MLLVSGLIRKLDRREREVVDFWVREGKEEGGRERRAELSSWRQRPKSGEERRGVGGDSERDEDGWLGGENETR